MSHVDDGKLHTYLDGECSERERQQLEDHLASCEVCRERLEEARVSNQSASSLLAELEPAPVQAPAWNELEQRAAARQKSEPRRAWARPSLAWAAVMALAFGVGWLSNSYMSRTPAGYGSAALQEDADAADLAVRRSDAIESETAPAEPAQTAEGRVAGEESDALGEGAVRTEEEQVASRRGAEPAPAESPVTNAAGREKVEEVTDDIPNDDRLAAATKRDRQVEPAEELKAAEAERGVDAFADRGVPEAEAAPRALAQPTALRAEEYEDAPPSQFVTVSVDDAAAWMGAQLRVLPELQLVSSEVGPGIAVAGGLAGLPAIKLTYLDAAGHVIVLVQQRTSEVVLLGEDADPTLVVDPTGFNAYRWHAGDGYRLILLGEVSGDSLRALAERVR